MLAAPLAGRVLADHGATVVRVESGLRPDPVRLINPFRGDYGDPEGSVAWHSSNAGKLSLALNLQNAEGRAVLLDLARWADVIVESFSPGVMERLGLGYEQLRAANPSVIVLSSTLSGHSGPIQGFSGVGIHGAALAGFYPFVAWPDRAPAGPYAAYTDYTSPYLTTMAILGALEWRRRTGAGQHIDFSQVEGAIHFLAQAILDHQVTGSAPLGVGNADEVMVPHGVYPGWRPGQWLAIACAGDGQWQRLATIIGRDDLASLDTDARRVKSHDIDHAIRSWSTCRPCSQSQDLLQASGIPAHTVQGSPECAADPQLVHRCHYRELPHDHLGSTFVEAAGFRLSRTPGDVATPGPMLGQHSEFVLRELLAYTDDQVFEVVMSGALE
jgi:benzylsuccinate CoA-transferase BbsF subunit